MAFMFKPGIWRADAYSPPSSAWTSAINSGLMFWLPLPITSLPISDEYKYSLEEPVEKDGANGVYGHKRKSRILTVTGQLSKSTVAGTVLVSDEEMFDFWRALAGFLKGSGNPMEFFLYYDLASTTYRKYKKVHTHVFSTDIGDSSRMLFPWNLQLAMVDPDIYTTAPGA